MSCINFSNPKGTETLLIFFSYKHFIDGIPTMCNPGHRLGLRPTSEITQKQQHSTEKLR